MNYINFNESYISALSESFDNEKHKHLMLQLVIKKDNNIEMEIQDKIIRCRGIIIDKNIEHKLDGLGNLYFFMFIDPTSYLARSIRRKYIKDKGYYIIKENEVKLIEQELENYTNNPNIRNNKKLIEKFISITNIQVNKNKKYDDRIVMLLGRLDKTDCINYSVKELAEELFISQSRLSHLFKEQTGIPLKSYLVLCKLQRAYIELARGKSITEASMIAGFDSSSHLAITNKNMTGMCTSNIIKNSIFLKVLDFKRR